MPPAAATWLAGDALNNGTIKEYLQRYSPQEWPEVTKLTLIYGIVALQHSCEGRLLSLRELRQAVETSNTTLVVQRNVPQLQRQILQLQSQLDSVFDKLTPEGPASTGQAKERQQQQPSQGRAAAALLRGRQGRVRQPAVAHPKPSDAWRQGEPSGYTSPPRSRAHPLRRSTDNRGATNPIYPDWWLAEPDAQQAADQQQQQSPRLVHPLQEQQQQLAINTFGMPGAQQQQQEQLLRGGLESEPTLLLRPADAATSQGQQQQAELPWGWQGLAGASTADAGPSRAPAAAARARRPAAAVLGRGLPSLRHVESKIKQSVAASRQKAAATQQQRHQLLSSVVATSSSHTPGQQQQQMRPAELEEACPPAATADQFISNPWTSWFVPGAPADRSAPAAAAAAAAAVTAADEGSSSDDEHSSTGALPGIETLSADSAAAAGGRGALQDITGGLNQLTCSSSGGIAAAEPLTGDAWGLPSSSFSFAAGSGAQKHTASRQPELHDAAATADLQWQPLPPQQQQQQQPWAADFGHLDSPQLDAAAQQAAAAAATGQRRAGPHQQRQQWRQRWVGNFGHLEGLRRPAPFSHHHQQQASDADADDDEAYLAADAAPTTAAGSGLLLSPADLQDLLGSAAAAAQEAAAAKVFAGDSSTEEEGRGAGSQGVEAASYAAMAAAEAEAADIEGELAAANDPGPSFGAEALRLHGELRATSSPTKRAAAAAATEFEGGFARGSAAAGSAADEQLGASGAGEAGGPEEADLAGSLLEGLGDTSAALRAALAQHGSVMALVGLLDSLGGPPGQQAAVGQEAGQQQAGAEWGGAAAQTAAWVAATAGDAESGASGAAAGGL
uniref:Uncharacterized protein n=1 Tax=Tetradesmus obliquus TaxID=3088 RepID=A0A383WBC4_TETOB|eukprot:jgi/Sobl393_1/2/SZX74741.1